jgi:hypothetical protein
MSVRLLEFLQLFISKERIVSAVEAKNSEVLTNTEATISCVVTGLTKQLDKVAWKNTDGGITHNKDGYKIVEGQLQGESQTTILTVPAAKNMGDAVYTCVIQCDEHGKTLGSEESKDVKSDVFSELYVNKLTIIHIFL